MKWNKIQFLLTLILTVIISVGCDEKDIVNSNNNGTYENEVKIDNPYFSKFQKRKYKGDFTFAEERDTKEVWVRCNLLGSSGKGELYQIKFDSIKDAKIPKELLNLGYFYVRENDIIRVKELSDRQKEKLLSDNKIPLNATIVCQMQPKRDESGKKGVHEKITINDDLVEYCYYDDSTMTNFYETFVWKRNVGIILYRRGYAAELDAITLWVEDYVEKPHEFSIQ